MLAARSLTTPCFVGASWGHDPRPSGSPAGVRVRSLGSLEPLTDRAGQRTRDGKEGVAGSSPAEGFGGNALLVRRFRGPVRPLGSAHGPAPAAQWKRSGNFGAPRCAVVGRGRPAVDGGPGNRTYLLISGADGGCQGPQARTPSGASGLTAAVGEATWRASRAGRSATARASTVDLPQSTLVPHG